MGDERPWVKRAAEIATWAWMSKMRYRVPRANRRFPKPTSCTDCGQSGDLLPCYCGKVWVCPACRENHANCTDCTEGVEHEGSVSS